MKVFLVITVVVVLFIIFDEYQANNSDSQRSSSSTTSSQVSSISSSQLSNSYSVAGRSAGYSFHEVARKGPSSESTCKQYGGLVEPSVSTWTLRRQLAQGLLVVYHKEYRREYLSVGFGERNLLGAYDLKHCLFNY